MFRHNYRVALLFANTFEPGSRVNRLILLAFLGSLEEYKFLF